MSTQDYARDEQIFHLCADPKTRDQGFRLMLDQYAERLYWHIREIVMHHTDADDVLQNTWLNVHRHLDRFQRQSSLYTWLYTIAKNEALSWLKKRKWSSEDVSDETSMVYHLMADPYFDGDENYAQFRAKVLLLPDKQREVFTLRYFHDMTYEEISELTGTSVGGLKSAYHHAKNKIMDSMQLNSTLL